MDMTAEKQVSGAIQRITTQRIMVANRNKKSYNTSITRVNDVEAFNGIFPNWRMETRWRKDQVKLTVNEGGRGTWKESTISGSQNEQGLFMIKGKMHKTPRGGKVTN